VKEVWSFLKSSVQEQLQTTTELEDVTCDYDNAEICCLADKLKALADETRLRIIHSLMVRGEMCVCEFMPLLGLIQSNISFHLKTLKYAGFIASRKEGKWMHYSLNRKAIEQFRADFEEVFDLGKWPENTGTSPCEDITCSRLKCR